QSFTRGRPDFSPAARSSSSIAVQPAYSTTLRPRSASSASTAAAVASGFGSSRPAAASSSRSSTVSVASFLFVPITPVGPRLIQPAQQTPGATQPPPLGYLPPAASNH